MTEKIKRFKQKKCPICGDKFEPFKSLQKVCGHYCAIEHAQKLRAKADRKELKQEKERIKSRGEYAKEAQTAFNAYIRARDADLPCISCGRHHAGQYHAGHYRTVGANPELRFCEINVWKQCAPCNDHLHGNIVNYRIELARRIGEDKLNWLEGPHEPKKYTIEELKEIKSTYRKKANELLKGA